MSIKKSSLLISKPSASLKLLKASKYPKKIKYSSENHVGIPASASLVMTLTNNPNEVLEMPTDPYEPVYCDCHDVSYGDMIGCDNVDVRTSLLCSILTSLNRHFCNGLKLPGSGYDINRALVSSNCPSSHCHLSQHHNL